VFFKIKTKILKDKVFGNVSFSILNNFFTLFVSIASGMIIARLLGPEGKGKLYLITQIISFGAIFFTLGLGSSLLFNLRQKKITKNKAISFSITYLIFMLLLLFILFNFLKLKSSFLLENNLPQEFAFYGFLLIFTNLIINFFNFILMNSESGVKTWSKISMFANSIYLILIFSLVYFYSNGIKGVLIALFITTIIKVVLLFKSNFSKGFQFSFLTFKELILIFKYALGIFVANLFLTSVYRIDTFFVNYFLSSSELGIYSVSVNLSELLLLVPSAIGVALFPHLTSLKKEERKYSMGKIGRLSLVLGIVCSSGIIILGYPFIILVYGEEFIGAYIPVLFLQPGLIAMTLNFAYANYLNSVGKPKIGGIIFAFGLLINVILNFFFLKETGIVGAAIFSSLTYILITISFLFSILFIHKDLKLKNILIPNKDDFKYIINQFKTKLKIG
jgi:O-antigen/teichoic acid export membrane protein